MARNVHRYAIPIAAFLAILPLLLHGPTCGHDFDFHLLSWLEAATQYAHGVYPHWAYTPAYNAGEPRFIFYPPISWTLGALLTLILPIQYVGTAFTFVALTLSGFTAHRLARQYASPQGALLVATLYLANPYMLFTAYERSAFAELLAAAFLPLLFQSAFAPQVRILPLAVPIALLWLTNAPAAVMGCYALAFLTTSRLVITLLGLRTNARDPKFGKGPLYLAPKASSPTLLTFNTLTGTALGLALPAFYLIPAAYERRYVQITLATIEGMRPTEHFLFHRMLPLTPDNDFHNAVVRTASIVALILLTGVAAAFAFAFRAETSSRPERSVADGPAFLLPSLALLTALLAFLLTPPSLFLWNHTPELAFLQFPWRLTALLAVVLLILTAVALRNRKPHPALSVLLALTLICPAYIVFHQPCDDTDTPTARAALFHSPLGTEPTDEYTPQSADNDALKPDHPAYWSACETASPDPNFAPAEGSISGATPTHLTLSLPCSSVVVLNRRNFPEWQLRVNNTLTQPDLTRDDGLIALNLPAGVSTIDLSWHRTPDQTLGLLISALAAILVIGIFLFDRHRRAPKAA